MNVDNLPKVKEFSEKLESIQNCLSFLNNITAVLKTQPDSSTLTVGLAGCEIIVNDKTYKEVLNLLTDYESM